VPCLERDGEEGGMIVLREVYKRVVLHFRIIICLEERIECSYQFQSDDGTPHTRVSDWRSVA
jgi:hypothetical protein